MPRELVMAAYLDIREGRLARFDARRNRMMLEFRSVDLRDTRA
jgi:hypothetical protein